MAVKVVNCDFFFKFLCLFIFFFPSFTFENERSTVGFSTFAYSGLSSSNTDDAWHFEVQGSPSIALEFMFWSALCQDWQTTVISLSFPVPGVAPNKVEFSGLAYTNFVGGLHCCGRINQTYNHLCTRMRKLVVRLTKRHSEKVLRSNNLISFITHWEINCAPLIRECE
jgi:hypothetical protein